MNDFPDRYTLAGQPLSTRHSPGMVAAAAVGGFAATPGPVSKAFLQALWDMPVPEGEQRYFDGMLYLMSLMHCAGEFRIIDGARHDHLAHVRSAKAGQAELAGEPLEPLG
jgi:oligosaccharide reducing-end xylanase